MESAFCLTELDVDSINQISFATNAGTHAHLFYFLRLKGSRKENNDRYQVQLEDYRAAYREYTAQCSSLRSQFNTWRTTEVERISKLKIAVPDVLKPVFSTIKAIGDTSK